MDKLRRFFEDLAFEWDESQPEDRDQVINYLLAPFDDAFMGCRSILDVGTGTGQIIPILEKRYPDARITSIDLALTMLSKAKERVPGANLTQSDVHFLPFRALSFEGVICHDCFPHFCNKKDALMSLKRVMNPGGKLLIFHDVSREKVNSVHQNAQNPIIHQDLLPKSEVLAKMMREMGFFVKFTRETDLDYSIYANC